MRKRRLKRLASAPQPVLDAFLKHLATAHQSRPCLLCGQPTLNVAFYLPNDPRDPGAAGLAPPAPAAQRMVIYGLCEACYARPDFAETVEAVLPTNPN